jgi:hypothetical protein
VVVPSALLLIAAGGGTAYYYSRVTGNPFRMTYQVNRATYAIAPYFLWERPYPEPQYRYAVMREFYEKELKEYEENRTLLGFIRRSASKLLSWWGFYLGPALTIPVLALPSALKDKRIRFAVVALSVFVFGLALETFMMPHYFAPATCLVYLLLMQAMRHLRLWRFRGDGRGLALVRAVPVICVGMIVLRLGAIAAHAQIEPAWPRGSLKRAGVISQLKQMHGDHLILVRYRPDHNLHDEYVYNGANIDSQRVIWARDSEGCDNQELFRYYHDRRIWLLEPDYWPLRLQPYPQQPPQLKCDSRP